MIGMHRLASLMPAVGVRRERARLARERDELASQIGDLQAAIADVERQCAAALAERDAVLRQPPAATPPISDRVIVVDCDRPERLDAVRACLALLTPVATAQPMTRIGRASDGGYVLADLHGEPRRAISLGVGGEMSFDRALLAAGYVVHQFDHSVAGPPSRHPDQHFNRIRVVGADPGPEETTLDDIVAGIAAAGHPEGPLLLKCDIEGDEWALFEHVHAATLARFNQIVIELHWLHRLHEPEQNRRIKACLDKITLNHAPIHVHGNNWGRLVTNRSFTFPNVLEVTFLRRDLLGGAPEPGVVVFPTRLDHPNHRDRPDYFLGPFVWRAD